MSQEPNRVTRDNVTASLRSPPWSGIHVLKLVHELNDRCLAELAQLAQSDRSPRAAEFFGQYRDDWRSLDAGARQEAARFPFLLLDIRFQDEEWWRMAPDPRSEGTPSNPGPSFFPPEPAGELIRETLVLAWHTVLSNRGAAMLLLGMSPAVCSRVAGLGLQHIERIKVIIGAGDTDVRFDSIVTIRNGQALAGRWRLFRGSESRWVASHQK